MLIDLHVHTDRTPGCTLEPALAVAKAEELGLDGLCFTDRDSLERAANLHTLRNAAKVRVLVGMEVETDHGRFLCFFPQPELVDVASILGPEAPATSRPARGVVERTLAAGGAVVAAHPYDRQLEKPMGDFVFTLRNLSAVEAFTGTRGANVNELAIEAADHLSAPCVGGSGAMTSYDQIGTAATLFKEEVHDEADLVRELRKGAVWAVSVGTPPKFHGDDEALRAPRERRDGGRRPFRDRRGGRHGGRGRG
ncbi:MAG TPA: PHP-associated domain-containing protein [Vulgatibacter sp.]